MYIMSMIVAIFAGIFTAFTLIFNPINFKKIKKKVIKNEQNGKTFK